MYEENIAVLNPPQSLFFKRGSDVPLIRRPWQAATFSLEGEKVQKHPKKYEL
jgi:hypothetical protein